MACRKIKNFKALTKEKKEQPLEDKIVKNKDILKKMTIWAYKNEKSWNKLESNHVIKTIESDSKVKDNKQLKSEI